ncbi:MAG: iron chaperone [Flavitalea sp.]
MATSRSPYGSEKYTSIDEYHSAFEKPVKSLLDKMRKIIRKTAPDAEEIISYNIPTYKGNKNLVHYAAFKEHIGFYPGPSAISVFTKELENYKTSKGAIQFPMKDPIPEELIKNIVEYRVAEDSNHSKQKIKKKTY